MNYKFLLFFSLVTTMLGQTKLNEIQICFEILLLIYLSYKITKKGLTHYDIFILLIVVFSHLLSILNIPLASAILNFKIALFFLLPILFFKKKNMKFDKIFYQVFYINSIIILLESLLGLFPYPKSILNENATIFFYSRPIGLFFNPHTSSTFTALFLIYLISCKPKKLFLIIIGLICLFLNASWTSAVAFFLWLVIYFISKVRFLTFLRSIYYSIPIILLIAFIFLKNFDKALEILKTLPNSRYYSVELMAKVLLDVDYYFSGISFLPQDYYSVIKFQEDILLLAVGNESSLLKIIIENGILMGTMIIFIAFKNMKSIGLFLFITMIHYSSFFISSFILFFGLKINSEIENK